MSDLVRFMKALDEDEGIRIEGKVKGLANGGFVFVGFYRGQYCLNTCDRAWDSKIKAYTAGGNDKYEYFERFEELISRIKPLIKKPIRAWLY